MKINLAWVFDYVLIETVFLKKLVKDVLLKINQSLDIYNDVSLGPIHECLTFSGEAGEVTEDGIIQLDSKKLKQYDYDVAMAIVAHELAHDYLKHYKRAPTGLEYEIEADELSTQWGFNIAKFRNVCGQPTVQP